MTFIETNLVMLPAHLIFQKFLFVFILYIKALNSNYTRINVFVL